MQTDVTNTSILTDDEQYLNEYYKICALFMKRYRKIRNSSSNNEALSFNDNKPPRKASKFREERIRRMSEVIRRKDTLFWEKVGKKRKFVIEEIANHYGLGLTEKKIMLLFLYFEFSGEHSLPKQLPEILSILDLDCSLAGRIKNSIYFSKERPLFKHKIINKIYEFSPKGKEEYCIGRNILKMISQKLNNEKVKLPEITRETIKEINEYVEEVGYAKRPEYRLEDVILKEETKEKVRFFLDVQKEDRFKALGVNKAIKNSKGITFLFYGPSGTGKSMLAEAIASYMNKKILIVDFPKIINKWFGDSEKNISLAFKKAKEKDLVIIINEADTLLCNRQIANHEHDIRIVNVMLNILENYEGIAVLTTNMDALLDHALERRIDLKVKFELPEEEIRENIWKSHIPGTILLSEDVDFECLAREYEFSGGNIKNAVLNAIRKMIVKKGDFLTMDELTFGADLEKEGMFSHNYKEKKVTGFVF